MVVDNDGGGIFSFLPQASALAPERFEQLFGTPHGVDLTTLAVAHGLPVLEALDDESTEVAVRAALTAGGVHLVLVRTDRAANVAVHEQLHAATAAAIAGGARPQRLRASTWGGSGRSSPSGSGTGAPNELSTGTCARPDRPGQVGLVVDRAARAGLDRPLADGEAEEEGGVELGVGGHPGLGGPPRRHVLDQRLRRRPLLGAVGAPSPSTPNSTTER